MLLGFSHTVLANDSGTDKDIPIIFINPSEQLDAAPALDEQFQVKRQSGFKYDAERAAIETDMGLLSEQSGIPLDKVKSSIAFQDAFYEYAEKVRARYPDQISGVWVQPVPAKVGGIRFVDNVPLALSFEVKKRGQGDQIRLVTGGKILEQNHADYTRSVCEAVSEMDITNFICEYNVPAGRIDVEIHTPDKATIPVQSEIHQSILKRAYSSQLMEKRPILSPDDIHIEIKASKDSVFVPTFHRGGMGAFRFNNPHLQCTTGWSVSGPVGDGLVTAGHCDHDRGGLKLYNVNHFRMFRQDYWYAPWTKDAAYYTNPGQPSVPYFYADFNDIRPVRRVKPTNTMVGRPVCRYGRGSNFRSCNHTVLTTNSSIYFGSYPFVLSSMVTVIGDVSICGDSGGGWSWGETAWGVHGGRTNPGGTATLCDTPVHGFRGWFTDLQSIESYFDVTVKRLPL